MADEPLLPQEGADVGTWDDKLNAYLLWLRGKVATLEANGGASAPVGRVLITALDRVVGQPIAPVVQAALAASSDIDFRATIGAGTGDGTSDLELGPGADQAAAGNHNHDERYATPTQVGQMIDASGARLQLGTTSTTAAPGDHVHDNRYYTEAEIDAKLVGLSGGGGGGNTVTTSAPITASAVINDFLDSPSSTDARAAIGAGTSSLALGTTSTTAAAGNSVVNLTAAQTIAGVKTFSAPPVVPAGSFTTAAVANLESRLAALEAAMLTTVKVVNGSLVRGITPVSVLPTTGVVDNDIAFKLPDA